MRRRGSRLRNTATFNWSFDTLSDVGTDNAFVIRRVSDNVEQSFTYAEVIDGTYATFISGSQGGIKEWITGSNKLTQLTTTAQCFLVVNSGKPYVDDTTSGSGFSGTGIVSSLSNDWIITAIFGKEFEPSNQRLLYGICGDVLYENFRLDLRPSSGLGYIKLNSTVKLIDSDISFTTGTLDEFSVYSFSKIGGVFSVSKNNIQLTLGSVVWSIWDEGYDTPNSIRLGQRGFIDAGKINKHQHLGIVYDTDLSGFDLSAHNNAIMTKYGIV